MPLGKLAPHVAQLAGFGLIILTTPELDFGKTKMPAVPFDSAAQLVKAFDEGAAQARTALKNTKDEAWTQPWKLSFGDKPIFSRDALSSLPANVSQSPGAPPRAARSVSAIE